MFTQLRNTVVSPVWSAKYDCLYKHFGWLLDCQAHFITNRKTNLKASHLETSCLSCQIDMRMCTCFCQILKNGICVCEREKKKNRTESIWDMKNLEKINLLVYVHLTFPAVQFCVSESYNWHTSCYLFINFCWLCILNVWRLIDQY